MDKRDTKKMETISTNKIGTEVIVNPFAKTEYKDMASEWDDRHKNSQVIYVNIENKDINGNELGESRIGEKVEKFIIEKLLGIGGMGTVYAARHQSTDRMVALKILHPEHSGDPEFLKRIKREAKTTSLIKHPNIVEIIDSGYDSHGVPFLAMELLEGQSLDSLMKKYNQMTIPMACYIISEILDTLYAAHLKGVIHRDLKPENIFLSTKYNSIVPQIKILDFGISKFSSLDDENSIITTYGTIIGTPLYMSLEQAMGRTVDPRADIYSVGVILYQLLSGELPFFDDNFNRILLKIAKGSYNAISNIRSDIPKDLELIIDKALQLNPEDRYQNAKEFKTLLLPFFQKYTKDEIFLQIVKEDENIPENEENQVDFEHLPNYGYDQNLQDNNYADNYGYSNHNEYEQSSNPEYVGYLENYGNFDNYENYEYNENNEQKFKNGYNSYYSNDDNKNYYETDDDLLINTYGGTINPIYQPVSNNSIDKQQIKSNNTISIIIRVVSTFVILGSFIYMYLFFTQNKEKPNKTNLISHISKPKSKKKTPVIQNSSNNPPNNKKHKTVYPQKLPNSIVNTQPVHNTNKQIIKNLNRRSYHPKIKNIQNITNSDESETDDEDTEILSPIKCGKLWCKLRKNKNDCCCKFTSKGCPSPEEIENKKNCTKTWCLLNKNSPICCCKYKVDGCTIDSLPKKTEVADKTIIKSKLKNNSANDKKLKDNNQKDENGNIKKKYILSQTDISNTVNKIRSKLKNCKNNYSDLEKKISVRAKINSEGTVIRAFLRGKSKQSKGATCILSLIKGLVFPKFDGRYQWITLEL